MTRTNIYNSILLCLIITIPLIVQTGCSRITSEKTGDINDINKYDETLAVSLGADDYGMKKYVFAFLKAGPNRSQNAETKAKLQRAHLDNISRLAEEGKLVLAGPFLDDGNIRGIYIFNVETIEEAEQLTNTDPAIQAGSLIMELHPWYGSAVLMKVNDWHERIARIGI